MPRYPRVLGEIDTLDCVSQGFSLARFGDGEIHLIRGRHAKLQEARPDLAARLRAILAQNTHGRCLVGIPNLEAETPKAAFWDRFRDAADLMGDAVYASAFVTRPDSAPWIDRPAYWRTLEALWVGQDVTLVRGTAKSLTAGDLADAGAIREIVAPARNAWRQYGALLEAIGRPARALLCLGPTATVLAVDLAARGVHAIDLGHIGMFLKKHRAGLPMTLTDGDRAA